MPLWKTKSRSFDEDLTPDEIFLDSTNTHGFAKERFEGVLERPLEKGAFYVFGGLLFLFGISLFGRAFWLQIVRGAEFEHRAESNYIAKSFIEAPRGIVYDRKGIPLVTNEAQVDEKGDIQYQRKVKHSYAYSHILGHIGRISDPDSEKQNDTGLRMVGKSGLELEYDERLHGVPGERDEELDASGKKVAQGVIMPPKPGEDIRTTLNAELQEFLWYKIDEVVRERGFRGGAGVVFSPETGEILSLVSVPSYDLNAFSQGLTQEQAQTLFNDPKAPLYNRALAGIYAPGSIMKPFVAIGALEEKVITPDKQIYSSGSISIPNPYQRNQPSIFRDWKAHGYVDMRRALAVSSDVYFYEVGGGYGDIGGLGVTRLKKWFTKFGLGDATGIDLPGEKVGVLPDPEWKKSAHPSDPTWRVGDTYHLSIGQGDMLVTPLAVARALGTLATKGRVPQLHLLERDTPAPQSVLSIEDASWQVVAEGMQQAAKEGGTAAALSWLPFPVAGKTGTAEIGNKERVNSWVMTYAPADHPKMAMVIFLESGARTNLVGGAYVASETYRWILDHGGIDKLFAN